MELENFSAGLNSQFHQPFVEHGHGHKSKIYESTSFWRPKWTRICFWFQSCKARIFNCASHSTQHLTPEAEMYHSFHSFNNSVSSSTSQGICSTMQIQSTFQSRWDIQNDLDRFLWNVYTYWAEGGLSAIITIHLTHLLALSFTIAFSCIFLVFINWKGLIQCTSEEACKGITFFVSDPFQSWPRIVYFLWLSYLAALSIFLVWNFFISYFNCREAWYTHRYYRKHLGIDSDQALAMLDWPEVVAMLLKTQEENPFCIVEFDLTALDIVNVIMRQENYLICITNRGLLANCCPKWVSPRIMYTSCLFWNMRTAIFMGVFDHRYRIDLPLYERLMGSNNVKESIYSIKLTRRFRVMAILNLLFLPPTFLFTIIYFFLRHSVDFRSNHSMPFKREFNNYAHWTFREINELPHHLYRRLSKASYHLQQYIDSVSLSPVMKRIKLCFRYVIGSFVAVLVASLVVVDETPLMIIKIGDRNLMWYLFVFGFIYSITGDVSDNVKHSEEDICADQNYHSPTKMFARLVRVISYTHFIPPTWRNFSASLDSKGAASVPSVLGQKELFGLHKYIIEDMKSNFFNLRLFSLLEELVGVLIAPIALFLWLPQSSASVSDFIFNGTMQGSIGDFCTLGRLDIVRNGNEFYNAPPRCNLSSLNLNASHTFPHEPFNLVTYDGKLEKSLLNFVTHYRIHPFFEEFSPAWQIFSSNHILLPDSGDAHETSSHDAPLFKKNLTTYLDLSQKWGYDFTAMDFLKRLEQFQVEQLSKANQLKHILPKELCVPLHNELYVANQDTKDSISENYKLCTLPISDEKQASYFYWLERYYEMQSGRVFYHIPKIFDKKIQIS